ncbi:MAG TPA: efflux transporter outer membrane subunit [Candidatus Binatia bacterium]|jgi:NodT family efflux transporter outer membrane factor (OMF) lipoprotein
MATAAALALLACGCPVGPDFQRPAQPEVTQYTSSPMPASLRGSAGEPSQALLPGQKLAADWWNLFGSEELRSVVEEALDGSPNLEAARATLAQAQELVKVEEAALYPQLDFGASFERRRVPSGSGTSGSTNSDGGSGSSGHGARTGNLFSLGPTVSYTPDVFGLTRRRIEQQKALARQQGFALAAAWLTLTGNAVSDAIEIASADAQILAATDVIEQDQQVVDLVQKRYQAGKVARSDLLIAESQLDNDKTQLPPLEQQMSVARHALAVLVGRPPQQWSPPAFELDNLKLPGELPVTLPSELVRQRPDILAAEASLHAATASIGVATAQMYPSITLSASAGLEATSFSSLFDSDHLTWSADSGINAPLFHGGALVAGKRAAVEGARASLAQYHQTVLSAFGQVADTLRGLAHDRDLVEAARRALDVSSESLALQRLTYHAGKTDLLLLLAAGRSYNQARVTYARAQAQRYSDTAELFVALGGGWWNASELTAQAAVASKAP